MNPKDLKKKLSGIMPPSMEELAGLREQALYRARNNPTCFTHWFPAVEALGIPAPRSKVIDFGRDLTEAIVDCKVSASVDAQLKDVVEQIRAFGREVGYPLFLKNSLCSAKHQWKDTCFIASEDSPILNHVLDLTHFWVRVGNVDSLYLVAREMIPTEPAFHAFNEMPITPEYRIFATGGKVNGWQPYWPEAAIENPSCEDWRERLAAIEEPSSEALEKMQAWAEAVTRKLGGYWSVDFLQDKDGGLWLIDMAEGAKSFKCSVGFRDCTPFSVGKVGEWPRARFATHDEAAKYIGETIRKEDPEGVHNGDYYLDSPQVELQPRTQSSADVDGRDGP